MFRYGIKYKDDDVFCSSLQVLLANFEPYHESGAAYNVTGVLTSLPTLIRGHTTANNVTVIMYRVSETEANARLVWERMGRPSSLSDQQKYALTSDFSISYVRAYVDCQAS